MFDVITKFWTDLPPDAQNAVVGVASFLVVFGFNRLWAAVRAARAIGPVAAMLVERMVTPAGDPAPGWEVYACRAGLRCPAADVTVYPVQQQRGVDMHYEVFVGTPDGEIVLTGRDQQAVRRVLDRAVRRYHKFRSAAQSDVTVRDLRKRLDRAAAKT